MNHASTNSTAIAASKVTVNHQATQRQGDTFYKALAVDNSTAAQFPEIKVLAVQNNVGPNGEDLQSESIGKMFLPQTPEIFTHDAEGNLTSDGRWSYTWDAENRLIQQETIASVPAAAKRKLEYAYDSNSRRIRKQVFNWNGTAWALQSDRRFLYDGWNLVAELDASNAILRNFVWGTDLSGSLQGAGGVGGLLTIREGTESHHPAFDGNGNVTALVKASDRSTAARYQYGPCGETLVVEETGISNSFRFSTKYYDPETGLYYYGFRYYDPVTGRWPSRDPIGEKGGTNLYEFCRNSAISHTDKLGLKLNKVSASDYIVKETPMPAGHHLEDGSTSGVFRTGMSASGPSFWYTITLPGALVLSAVKYQGGDPHTEDHEKTHIGIFVKNWNALADQINWVEKTLCRCGPETFAWATALTLLRNEENYKENLDYDKVDYAAHGTDTAGVDAKIAQSVTDIAALQTSYNTADKTMRDCNKAAGY